MDDKWNPYPDELRLDKNPDNESMVSELRGMADKIEAALAADDPETVAEVMCVLNNMSALSVLALAGMAAKRQEFIRKYRTQN